MRVAFDAHQARPFQFPRDPGALVRKGQIERGALSIEPMGVVQHGIRVEDIDGTGADDLNGRIELALLLIQHRRLVRLAPGLALRHVLEVHHCVLHALVQPDADLRFVAGTSANLSVFGGNDLLDRHRALKDDLALDIPTPGDGDHVVGKRWNANEDGQDCC